MRVPENALNFRKPPICFGWCFGLSFQGKLKYAQSLLGYVLCSNICELTREAGLGGGRSWALLQEPQIATYLAESGAEKALHGSTLGQQGLDPPTSRPHNPLCAAPAERAGPWEGEPRKRLPLWEGSSTSPAGSAAVDG